MIDICFLQKAVSSIGAETMFVLLLVAFLLFYLDLWFLMRMTLRVYFSVTEQSLRVYS